MADYLYVAFRSGGFRIIDWTDVSNMSVVSGGNFGIYWGFSGVFEKNDLLYTGAMQAEFAPPPGDPDKKGVLSAIFDVSDPTSPSLISTIDLPDYLMGSNINNNICATYVFSALNGSLYLCVIDRQSFPGMRVFNVDDLLNPHIVAYFGGDSEGGMFANAAVNNGMYFDAGFLYVSDLNGLHVFDFLNDPEIPVYVGSFGGSSYEGVGVSGTSMYVGRKTSPYGLTLFDISNPGSPVKVKDFDSSTIGMNESSGEYGVEFAVTGTNLIVGTRPDAVAQIRVYDITSTDNIVHLGNTNLRSLVSPGGSSVKVGMAVKDGYIVHSAGEDGLAIIELATVTPASFSPFPIPGASDPYFIAYDLYWSGPPVPEGPGAKVSSIIDLYTGSSGIMHVARRAPALVQEAMDDDTPPRIYDIMPRPYARLSDQVSTITFHVQDDETPVLDETLNMTISGTSYVTNGTAVNGALIGVSQDTWGGKTYSVTLPTGVQTPVGVSVSIRNGAGLEAQRTWWYGSMTHGPYTSIDLSYTVVDDVMAVTDVTVVIIDGQGIIDPDFA